MSGGCKKLPTDGEHSPQGNHGCLSSRGEEKRVREEREGGGGTREVKVFSCQGSWLERPRYGLSPSSPSSDPGAPKSLLQALLGWKQPEPWGSEARC